MTSFEGVGLRVDGGVWNEEVFLEISVGDRKFVVSDDGR